MLINALARPVANRLTRRNEYTSYAVLLRAWELITLAQRNIKDDVILVMFCCTTNSTEQRVTCSRDRELYSDEFSVKGRQTNHKLLMTTLVQT